MGRLLNEPQRPNGASVCGGADSPLGFSTMAKKLHPARCAECEQLWKDYGDASLQRVRAYGNLALANLRSDSETMEMLADAKALANQKLDEVKKKIQEHEATSHAFQKPAYPTS